ncbi:glycosyltransferase [Actinoplanes sp. NPDC049681]|uniref:glycosyltransferase n=1 Tax=Actinoplanes sp. NPDC049681 TaxID=3363905 RepID=UPI00379E9BB2
MSVAVLHVAQPADGGVARYVVAACLDQMARGWRVSVACPDGGRLADDLARAGIPRLRWRAVRSPGPEALSEALRLRALVDRTQPDVVHLHASKAGLAGRLRPCRRVPVLFQPHGWSWLAVDGALRAASLAWERAAARWTDLLLCVGQGEAEQGRAGGVRGRYAVVQNGVDLLRFRPAGPDARAAARDRLGRPRSGTLAVCVGRLTRQKGQDVLLAAWPAVLARCPAAELALVGAGELDATLRSARAPGVTFAGAVDDVRDWLAAADVVVLPSRWEGLSLTVLEALATGRSVVVSDVPGLAEAVAPTAGARVAPGDPAALAAAVTRRLLDPALAAAEGAVAVQRAAHYDQRLTFDRLAGRTAAIAARGRGTR